MHITMNPRCGCTVIVCACLLAGCQSAGPDNTISSLNAESRAETASGYMETTVHESDNFSSEGIQGTDAQSTMTGPTKAAQEEYDQYQSDRWFDENGTFRYPFDQREDVSGWQSDEIIGRYHVPADALERASTYDLLQVCKDFQLSNFTAYNLPSDFLRYETNVLNAVDELLTREDLVEILLEDYQEELYPSASGEIDLYAEQRIVFDELILADNEIFNQMTDEQRQYTLEAVFEKNQGRESGKYKSTMVFAFGAYICEQQDEGGSDWYEYIMSDKERTDFRQMMSETDVYDWLVDWTQFEAN